MSAGGIGQQQLEVSSLCATRQAAPSGLSTSRGRRVIRGRGFLVPVQPRVGDSLSSALPPGTFLGEWVFGSAISPEGWDRANDARNR